MGNRCAVVVARMGAARPDDRRHRTNGGDPGQDGQTRAARRRRWVERSTGRDGGKGGGGSITIWCDRLVRGPQLVPRCRVGASAATEEGPAWRTRRKRDRQPDDNDSSRHVGRWRLWRSRWETAGQVATAEPFAEFSGFDFSDVRHEPVGCRWHRRQRSITRIGGNGETAVRQNGLAALQAQFPRFHGQQGIRMGTRTAPTAAAAVSADFGLQRSCRQPWHDRHWRAPPAGSSIRRPKTYQIIRVEAEQAAFEGTIANIWAVWTRAKVWGSWNEIHTPIDANGADGQAPPAADVRKAGTPGRPAPCGSSVWRRHGSDIRGRGFGPGKAGRSAPTMQSPCARPGPLRRRPRVGISPASNYPGCWSIVDDRSLALQLERGSSAHGLRALPRTFSLHERSCGTPADPRSGRQPAGNPVMDCPDGYGAQRGRPCCSGDDDAGVASTGAEPVRAIMISSRLGSIDRYQPI